MSYVIKMISKFTGATYYKNSGNIPPSTFKCDARKFDSLEEVQKEINKCIEREVACLYTFEIAEALWI